MSSAPLAPFHLAIPVRDVEEAREFYTTCVAGRGAASAAPPPPPPPTAPPRRRRPRRVLIL